MQFVNHVLSYFGLQVVQAAKAAGCAAAQAAAQAAEASVEQSVEEQKAKLVKLLNHGDYKFRTLDRLAKAIGKTDDIEYVKGLLRSVGARSAFRDASKWGLKSVVGERAGSRYSY